MMFAIARATFDTPILWYDVEIDVVTRCQAEFCQISRHEPVDERPIYNPVRRDGGRLKGGA